MGNGMPSWEEWEHLSEDVRQYKQYEVLKNLSIHDCAQKDFCEKREQECAAHFAKLEKRKWFDRVIAVGVGIGTGIATALGIKVGS